MTEHYSTRRRLQRKLGSQPHHPTAHHTDLNDHGHARPEHRHATNESGTLFETSVAEAKNVVTKRIIDRVQLIVQTGLNVGHEFTQVIPSANQSEEQTNSKNTEAPSLLSPVVPVSSDKFKGSLALIGNYNKVKRPDNNSDLIHLKTVSVVAVDTTVDQPTIGRTLLAIDFDNASYVGDNGKPAELPLLRTTNHLLRLMQSQILAESIRARGTQAPGA